MSRRKLTAASQKFGFMVGNTIGTAEYADLSYLGIVMHTDLIHLQIKKYNYLSERNQPILETSEDQTNLHATSKFHVFKVSTKTKN